MANNRIVKLDVNMDKIDELTGIDMPLYVYVDNDDNILVCELGSNMILKYDNNFQRITQWGGKGDVNGTFNIPRSIVADSLGNYYVSDELNHRIQKFDNSGTHLATYGSYGSADGQFMVQQGLSIDAEDRLYVADTYNNRIQVFETSPTWAHVKSFGKFGIYQPFDATSFQADIMNHPRGVYVERETGKVAVTDSSNNRVMVYNDFNSNFSFSQSQNGFLNMSLPAHAILEDGKLIVADSHSRILEYTSTLNNTNLFIQHGDYRNDAGMVSNAQSVCVNQKNGDVYVSDSFNHRVQIFDSNGTYEKTYGGMGGPMGAGSALNYFNFPKQVTLDQYETVYVADFANSRIVAKGKYSPSFVHVSAGSTVKLPWGVAVNGGKLYVSDWSDDKIKVIYNGYEIDSFGGSGTGNGQFAQPADIKVGVYKGQTALYIADVGNNRIQIMSTSGRYLGEIGAPTVDPLELYDEAKQAGSFLLPYSMAMDANHNVIVSDTSHKTMRMYNSNGTLLETWGEMSNTDGNFFAPMGCDINKSTGRLYVVDGVLERVQYFNKK